MTNWLTNKILRISTAASSTRKPITRLCVSSVVTRTAMRAPPFRVSAVTVINLQMVMLVLSTVTTLVPITVTASAAVIRILLGRRG